MLTAVVTIIFILAFLGAITSWAFAIGTAREIGKINKKGYAVIGESIPMLRLPLEV